MFTHLDEIVLEAAITAIRADVDDHEVASSNRRATIDVAEAHLGIIL